MAFPVVGEVTVSLGVAEAPLHASSARELIACADLAMLEGKGKNRVATMAARGELRSVAHLRTLQSLSTKLNRLNDVSQIGEAITAELRTLIDYHNCRVFLLAPDGRRCSPSPSAAP